MSRLRLFPILTATGVERACFYFRSVLMSDVDHVSLFPLSFSLYESCWPRELVSTLFRSWWVLLATCGCFYFLSVLMNVVDHVSLFLLSFGLDECCWPRELVSTFFRSWGVLLTKWACFYFLSVLRNVVEHVRLFLSSITCKISTASAAFCRPKHRCFTRKVNGAVEKMPSK